MSYDGSTQLRAGETRPLYGQLTAETGSLTITAATVTLYDDAGAAVVGHSAVSATGYDTGALAAPRAWYRLASAGLVSGARYTLVFTVTATGSDGIVRTYRPELRVEIAAVP